MNKWIKILAGVVAFVLIGGILWFANGLVGNPISKMIAERTAKQYIETNYPQMELEISNVFYNFKDGRYHVDVQSPTSMDTYFSIDISQKGKVRYDSYEGNVVKRWNTYERIEKAYRSMVEDVFGSMDFPYESDIDFGELKIKEATLDKDYVGPIYGLDIESLELDKGYDIVELGKTAGHLIFYTEDEDVSAKRAAEILLDIKSIFDKENVPFYAIDFVLEKSRAEEEKPDPNGVAVRVSDFLYSDIYEEGLEQRIADAAKVLQAYYDEQDAKKEAELGQK